MNTSKKNTSKYGLIACASTAILLVALLLINCLFGLLPKKATSFDISNDNRYSITDSTKRFLSKTNKEVAIYMLSIGGKDALQDQSFQLSVFLERMVEYSDHVTFSVVDPQKDPELITELGATSATNGSIVVKSNERSRILPLSSFFYLYIDGVGKVTSEQAQLYLTYYGSQIHLQYAFEGENLLVNAISYVTADSLPKIYTLSGHGEGELSQSLISTLGNNNMDIGTLTLTEAGVPSDCTVLLINLPTTDLSAAETLLVLSYIQNGGKLFLTTSPDTPQNLPNIMAIAESFGMSAQNGIVMETNSEFYYQLPYYLIPGTGQHSAVSANIRVMLPLAHGILLSETIPSDTVVTPLFSTSANAYIIDTDAKTMEKPEDQDAKVHHVGVISEKKNGSALLWISSLGIADETANSYVSGNNYNCLVNILSNLSDAPDIIHGELSFLSLDTLSVSKPSAAAISIALIFIIPIALLAVGFVYWMRRRRK